MLIPVCPNCDQRSGRLLLETSSTATVNYYRCDECGHLWHIPKLHPEAPLTDVTPKQPRGPSTGG